MRAVIKNRDARRGKSQNAVKNRETRALSIEPPINESYCCDTSVIHFRRASARFMLEKHACVHSAPLRAFLLTKRESRVYRSRSRDSRSHLGITFRDRERRERIREIEIEKGTIAIGRQRFLLRNDVRRLNSSSQEKQPERSLEFSRNSRVISNFLKNRTF